MIDLEQAAAKLYGGSPEPSTTATKGPTPPTTATAKSDGVGQAPDAATALYGAPKADAATEAEREAEETRRNLREAKEADAEERQVIEGAHGASMRTIHTELTERAGWDPEAARQQAEAAGRLFHANGINGDDGQFVSEVAIAAAVNPPTADVLNRWRASAFDTLRQEFGDTADLALNDARKLVKQDKRLHDYLDRTGLGEHPAIVRVIANRARALRNAGRL